MSNDSSTTTESVSKLATANTAQAQVGVQMQAYCNSVLEQPSVSFAGFENLAKYETEVNAGIAAAKEHATTYVKVVKPAIVTNISNISNYFDLHGAVATTVPEGATKEEWLTNLGEVKDAVDEYIDHAKGVVSMLGDLHGGLVTDVGAFATTVSRLNAAVNGDNGVLDSLDDQINDLQGKIAGAITGIVLSGLAVVGGGIMILVGALAEAVTGGLATALVVGGAAVLIAGVGGAVGAGVALGGLLSAKSDLITRKSNLKAEVQLALGMKTGFGDLRDQASAAVNAATAMQNAWEFLGSDLGQLSTDLNKGIIGSDAVRKLWLTTANKAIATVSGDVTTIKNQMTGATERKAPENVKIGDFVTIEAQKLAA